MNKDSFQDKYQEIFQEMKEEKMDWNFDDFLAQTEEKPQDTKIDPLHKKSSKQWLYIAASLVLISGFGIILKNNFSENTNIKPTEIAKTNTSKTTENQNIDTQPSKTVENSHEILENPEEEYSADYVIVNSKKIYNEEESIDITKEAFQLFSSNFTKTKPCRAYQKFIH